MSSLISAPSLGESGVNAEMTICARRTRRPRNLGVKKLASCNILIMICYEFVFSKVQFSVYFQ